jgi:CHAD domain-containing protein
MSQNPSKTSDIVEKAYRGLAERLFEKASAACDRLETDDPEALHDFRVALRRLRTHLSTHRDHLGKHDANEFRKRLTALVAATNTSRDQEVQREWIQRRLEGDEVEGIERDGLELVLTRFSTNGDSMSELDPIRQHFADIGKKFHKRRWSLPDYARLKDAPDRSVRAVTKAAVLKLAAKLRKQIAAIDSVDSVKATHQARLAVKRLRYILEPLDNVTPGASEVIDELKRMQDTLGAIRDMQILHLQIALAAGVADELGDEHSGNPLDAGTATASPPPALDNVERKALDAAMDHVRVEAQKDFKVLQERWLDDKAAPLLKRVEKLVATL